MIMKSCTPLCQWLIEWLCRQLTWMDLLGCRRREKREERREKREQRTENRGQRREKREEKLLVVLALPSLAIPLTSHIPEQSKRRYMQQYECSKDLHHDIKRGRRGDKRGGGGEKVKEEMTHTWDDLCLYLSVHLRQQVTCAVHWSSTCTQGRKNQSEERWKEDNKYKETKNYKNNIKLNIKKEKKFIIGYWTSSWPWGHSFLLLLVLYRFQSFLSFFVGPCCWSPSSVCLSL